MDTAPKRREITELESKGTKICTLHIGLVTSDTRREKSTSFYQIIERHEKATKTSPNNPLRTQRATRRLQTGLEAFQHPKSRPQPDIEAESDSL